MTHGRCLKNFQQTPVSNGEFLRENSSLPGYPHEICVADPPRHHVKVKVLTNASSRAMSEIQPDIESFGPIKSLKAADATLGKLHHFGQLRRRSRLETSRVGEGGNHEVPGGVGKQIQDDKIVNATIDNQALCVPGRIVTDAEDA